jgi:hypothetical protein
MEALSGVRSEAGREKFLIQLKLFPLLRPDQSIIQLEIAFNWLSVGSKKHGKFK